MNNKERFEELLSKASERPGFDEIYGYIDDMQQRRTQDDGSRWSVWRCISFF